MRLGISTSLARPMIRHGSTLPHVADANARLSIDPTGKVAGYQVIQDDDGLTYTFNGDGADADAGLWVTLAGDAIEWDGAYLLSSERVYTRIFGGTPDVNFEHGCKMGSSYSGGDDATTYPWEPIWAVNGGSPPAPTVIRNPICSETNWSHP